MHGIDTVRQISQVSGEYSFTICGKPASQQPSAVVKKAFQDKVRKAVAGCKNIFSREVELIVTWSTDCQERYTTDASPDTDNIIKPLLDSLVGREGLIFDDCQIQSVHSYWLDKTPGTEDRLKVMLRTLNGNGEEVVDKDRTVFFQYDGPVYYLFPLLGKQGSNIVYQAYTKAFSAVAALMKLGVPVQDAESLWPLGAVRFHISRINNRGFACIKKEDIATFLDSLPE